MNVEGLHIDDAGDFSFLASVNKSEQLFSVPNSYFDDFSASLISQIRLEKLKAMSTIVMPQNYFSTLSDKILERIKVEKETTATQLLEGISKIDVYTIPDNYFDTFGTRVSSKLSVENSEAKIIPLQHKRKTWGMAVAAAVISAVVLCSGLVWENRNSDVKQRTQFASVITDSGNIQERLSNLSSDEINDYLSTPDGAEEEIVPQDNSAKTEVQISSLSQEDLENYLDKTPAQF